MDTLATLSKTASLLFRQAAAPSCRLRVSIVIPVRNEASHLTETLTALANQVDAAGRPLQADMYEVLLLANNCTDDSAAIAHGFRYSFPTFNLHIEEVTLPAGKSTIGQVRRMLMDEAFNRLQAAASKRGIIASTDGDTIVDQYWVYQIIKEIDKGNDAVGGRILTRAKEHPVRLYYLRDVMHRTLLAKAETVLDPSAHDAWPKHFQYFGANLAVTCSAYVQAGRLPAVAYLEDNAFHEALLLVDAKVRKSNAVRAYTSTRLCGKVEIGFSEQLRKWNEMAQSSMVQLVEPAKASLTRYENRFLLRRCRDAFFQNNLHTNDLGGLAQRLSLSADWLAGEIKTSTYFGRLWQRVEQKRSESKPPKVKLVPITQAIHELRLFLQKRHYD